MPTYGGPLIPLSTVVNLHIIYLVYTPAYGGHWALTGPGALRAPFPEFFPMIPHVHCQIKYLVYVRYKLYINLFSELDSGFNPHRVMP